jgi:hypothetical protein
LVRPYLRFSWIINPWWLLQSHFFWILHNLCTFPISLPELSNWHDKHCKLSNVVSPTKDILSLMDK